MLTWAEISLKNMIDALRMSAKIYKNKPDMTAYDYCNNLEHSLNDVLVLFRTSLEDKQQYIKRNTLP